MSWRRCRVVFLAASRSKGQERLPSHQAATSGWSGSGYGPHTFFSRLLVGHRESGHLTVISGSYTPLNYISGRLPHPTALYWAPDTTALYWGASQTPTALFQGTSQTPLHYIGRQTPLHVCNPEASPYPVPGIIFAL